MKDLPSLPYHEWRDTRDTLHRWMQVVGKIRLRLTPKVNHWWNVPLYVSARGLTTSAIPIGDRWFEIEFDFVDHVLRVQPHDQPAHLVELAPRTVADFYAATMAALRAADIDCRIWTMPVEIAAPTRFEHDDQHRSYDRAYVIRFLPTDLRVRRRAGRLAARRARTLTKHCEDHHGDLHPLADRRQQTGADHGL